MNLRRLRLRLQGDERPQRRTRHEFHISETNDESRRRCARKRRRHFVVPRLERHFVVHFNVETFDYRGVGDILHHNVRGCAHLKVPLGASRALRAHDLLFFIRLAIYRRRYETNLFCTAQTAACVRSLASSFLSMFWTCSLIVSRLSCNDDAISLLLKPMAI